MKSTNIYSAGISRFYDQIVERFYFDYKKLAHLLAQLIGEHRKNVLEIGIGTGLVAEQLMSYGYQLTGIDFSEEMLSRARTRLGENIPLFNVDIKDFCALSQYDAVFSIMGPWYITCNHSREYSYLSYLRTNEENRIGLENVSQMLRPEGILILSVQKPHQDLLEQPIGEKLYYSHKVARKFGYIKKDYSVKRENHRIAAQSCIFKEYKYDEVNPLLHSLGFSDIKTSPCGNFVFVVKLSKS